MESACRRYALEIADEVVVEALAPDGGGLSVATDHLGFIVEREQLGLDRPEDLSVVAAGQVGPADRVVKERVPRD